MIGHCPLPSTREFLKTKASLTLTSAMECINFNDAFVNTKGDGTMSPADFSELFAISEENNSEQVNLKLFEFLYKYINPVNTENMQECDRQRLTPNRITEIAEDARIIEAFERFIHFKTNSLLLSPEVFNKTVANIITFLHPIPAPDNLAVSFLSWFNPRRTTPANFKIHLDKNERIIIPIPLEEKENVNFSYHTFEDCDLLQTGRHYISIWDVLGIEGNITKCITSLMLYGVLTPLKEGLKTLCNFLSEYHPEKFKTLETTAGRELETPLISTMLNIFDVADLNIDWPATMFSYLLNDYDKIQRSPRQIIFAHTTNVITKFVYVIIATILYVSEVFPMLEKFADEAIAENNKGKKYGDIK